MKAKNEEEVIVTAICKEIKSKIESMIPKYDYTGFVKEVGKKPNYCTVVINQQEYEIKNGSAVSFKAGDRCLVHCISGRFNNKVIIAKI